MTKHQPYFSVIIPAYNSAQFIEFALRSVLQQTFQDFEIIIVDDGSTDNTYQILSSYKDNNKVRILRQQNQGVSVARNKGIKDAQGKYIALLDSDDAWTEDHLELAAHFFSSYPEFVWYTSKYEAVSDITKGMLHTQASRKKTCYQSRNWALEEAVKPQCSNIIILRKIIKENLFPEGLKMYEDTIAFLRIAIHYPMVGFYDDATSFYRKWGNSSSDNFYHSKDKNEVELQSILHLQKLTQNPQCSKDVRMYIDYISCSNWWHRIRAMSMKPWINEIKQRHYLNGVFLSCWLIFFAYISEVFCRLVGKIIRLRYNSLEKKIAFYAKQHKKTLDD